jgi:hypothetical protein
MFNRETVFILGAGASAEFGLPTGLGLAQAIRKKMDVRFRHGFEPVGNGDHDLYQALKDSLPRVEKEQLLPALWRIRDGITLSNSIDDFLDRHQSDRLMQLAGKAAIASAILDAERDSSLMPEEMGQRFKIEKTESTWLLKLIRMMGTGVVANRIFDSVSFISFNYDRTLEQFLFQTVQDLYALDDEETASVMSQARIFHPYGSLGPISGASEIITFGGFRGHTPPYPKLTNEIFTYTEKIRDQQEIATIHEVMQRAHQLVFLGFGFHLQNMQLLKANMDQKPVYATAYETSHSNQAEIKNRIVDLFADNRRIGVRDSTQLINGKAAALLDEYRFRLMA